MGFGQVKSFQGLFRRFLWWRKRGFYGNTQWRLTVTQKTTKSTRGWWWWWKGFPKRIWWPCADESHQSHILDSGAKVRGQSYSACFNAGQDRFSTWVDLIYGEQEQDVLSPDTQSFTAAIKLVYSEAKKTQLFQQNIRTRLASSYVQMTGEEHRCVCVFMQRQQYVFMHTHTHARRCVDGQGCRHTVVREAAFSLSPGSVLEAASLKKVWTFLEFQLKIWVKLWKSATSLSRRN